MAFRDTILPLKVILFALLLLYACGGGNRHGNSSGTKKTCIAVSSGMKMLADELEKSLFEDIVDHWYPRNIDSLFGGYLSDFDHDWELSESAQVKSLVQQARHVWATSFLYEYYPERKEFLDYATHGFRFLRDRMWDPDYGGFYVFCNRDGSPEAESINDKRIYGQAFAVYGLSQYYSVSGDPEALKLVKKAFLWMEDHAHDMLHGGYFEFLKRDGTHFKAGDGGGTRLWDSPAAGWKDYNSSIHLMEALTSLYEIWPDSLVRSRLEEMFFLIRDTFVHPEGYLQLYFYPDWTLVPDRTTREVPSEDHRFNWHYTYGHDVETAYLLLETAHALGWEEDRETFRVAKRLVDHSLESGWDTLAGGFFDAGKQEGDEIRIINDHKSWWAQAEGMNALLMMHLLYPGDPNDYYGKFLASWEHIKTFLIDPEYGGWFNYSLDTYPGNSGRLKSHIWKTTYHNTRAMIHCIRMLRQGTL